jgi:hypothetical protein
MLSRIGFSKGGWAAGSNRAVTGLPPWMTVVTGARRYDTDTLIGTIIPRSAGAGRREAKRQVGPKSHLSPSRQEAGLEFVQVFPVASPVVGTTHSIAWLHVDFPVGAPPVGRMPYFYVLLDR